MRCFAAPHCPIRHPGLQSSLRTLKAHPGRAFIHLGPHQPAEFHALVHAMNEALDGRGSTYELIEAVEVAPTDQSKSLHDLVADMAAGRVQTLVIIDCNPVFTAPSTLGFTDALQRVPFSLAMSIEPNETSQATQWAIRKRIHMRIGPTHERSMELRPSSSRRRSLCLAARAHISC